jgi:hypothetical protein
MLNGGKQRRKEENRLASRADLHRAGPYRGETHELRKARDQAILDAHRCGPALAENYEVTLLQPRNTIQTP